MILPHSEYVVFSVKQPIIWQRDVEESWMLNPPNRYIANADTIASLAEHTCDISNLCSMGKYRPLRMGMNIVNQRILVERHRERGIGDLLFLTGPLSYLQHICGGKLTIDLYGLSDRSQVLQDHPALSNRTVLSGPLMYESIDHYAAQWFVNTVTETCTDDEQMNVYDVLYQQLGVDPEQVDPRFKRPTVSLTSVDEDHLNSVYYQIYNDRSVDLRKEGYYVVAPLSHSSLRSVHYGLWLDVVQRLSQKRPVVIVGHVVEGQVPHAGMSFPQFNAELNKMPTGRVINIMGSTRVRVLMALLAKARAVCCGDTGTLYIAQAVRTPAVSLWGTHHPRTRLQYDSSYMGMAMFNGGQCPGSPCYSYSTFPAHRCPNGAAQTVCQALNFDPDQVADKVFAVESSL